MPAEGAVFQTLGVWHEYGSSRITIYPGSQVRFGLKGTARIAIQSGESGSPIVAVRKNGETVWKGSPNREGLAVDGGSTGAVFSIIYLAASHSGFDPAMPEAQSAELRFDGAVLGLEGEWQSLSGIKGFPVLDFIGDSITAGLCLSGVSPSRIQDADASQTYAFRLAEKLQSQYRIRAFPGDGFEDLVGKFPYFRKGVPLSVDETPALLFVNIGANERLKDKMSYRSGARNLLNAIFKMYPDTRVVLLNFYRMTPNRFPILNEVARLYPVGSVTCFDARPFLVGYSDEGIHPDTESHRLLTDALFTYVKQKGLLDESRIQHEAGQSVPVAP